MRKPEFSFLTTKEIKPEGWLRRQLEIQAEGLSGHLDLIWPDIRDSKWIGGDKDGWERVPYWLDGFIPLAYLLDDEELKQRAKKYVDAIVDRQQEDGWICPCEEEERETYDIWPAFLICKVLVLYYECSGDERIEDVVYRAMYQMLQHIVAHTIFNWAATRWYEALIPLFWLYERRPETWMLDLAHLLDAEGVDFEKIYQYFDFARPKKEKYWTQINHVVNTAMALKSRALMSRITGEYPDLFARQMYATVMKDNSMVTGHFTGDECLSGDLPIQGSECCSVTEAMYSYEILLAESGNTFWGDLLEKLTFNALPATTTPDMWTHQYVQMTNQIFAGRILDEAVPFNSNSGEANMFGLEPNFGCCTANFNQGWPKYALSVVMESDKGLAVQVLAPVKVQVEKDGVPVTLRIDTQYPFKDGGVLEIETESPVEMELAIRIPGFVKEAWIDGKKAVAGSYVRIWKRWDGKTTIPVKYEFEMVFVSRPNELRAVVCGPLVFALPIEARVEKLEYIRDGVERKAPYCDYEMSPVSDWNYGFCSDEFELIQGEIGEYPFSVEHPPVKLRTKMVKVLWKEKNGICAVVPEGRTALGEAEDKELQPYGCTNLRMTEMPWVHK